MQPSPWNDQRITAYALGELSPRECSQLEEEMQSHPEIAKAVEEARGITSQLAEMFAAEPPLTLEAIKRDQILDARASMVASAATAGRDDVSLKMLFALAATVLLLGSLGTWLYASRDALRVASSETVASRTLPTAPAADETTMGRVLGDSRGTAEATEATEADDLDFATTKPRAMKIANPPTTVPQVPAPATPQMPASGASAVPMDAAALSVSPLGAAAPPSPSQPTPFEFSREAVADAISPSNTPAEATARWHAPADEYAAAVEGMATSEMGNAAYGTSSNYESSFGVVPLSNQVTPKAAVAKESELALGEALPELRKGYVELEIVDSEPMALAYEGRGPDLSGDQFEPIQENEFRRVSEEPLSTFSIDVDTASYSKVRQFLLQSQTLPPPGAVRIEELVNYFDYAYEPPAAQSEHPFASRVEIAGCPWKPEHRLARIAIKGKVMENGSRPASNLVFLVDTSGSMNEPNKLPLVKQGLQKLVGQLGERDRVAIVVYAGSAGLVLDSTPASERSTILRRINQMQSGGSTNGGEGIRLAYQVARDHFVSDGVNRVILCSDGDFNVGTTSDDELVQLVEKESKGGIDLTVLGFGMGNHNDAMMEKISGRGNGNYAFIDSEAEAQRVLVEQTSSTLVTIARDVKIQVEFNPTKVAAYRLIGYENRRLANEDFNDDTKDAGEIGAGHSVTALYELIPAGGDAAALAPPVDELRYQTPVALTEASNSDESMTVKLRYKKPDSDVSVPVSFPATDNKQAFAAATEDFRFAAAVAGFGMLLRSSEHIGSWTFSDAQKAAEASKGNDPHELRAEFVELVRRAASLRVGER